MYLFLHILAPSDSEKYSTTLVGVKNVRNPKLRVISYRNNVFNSKNVAKDKNILPNNTKLMIQLQN